MVISILEAKDLIANRIQGTQGFAGIGINQTTNNILIYIESEDAKRDVLSKIGIYPYGYNITWITSVNPKFF